MMVGRTIYEEAPQVPEQADQAVVLEVRSLSRGRAVRDVSFQLRRGEILGVAGLVGAGRTELGRLIFGADQRIRADPRGRPRSWHRQPGRRRGARHQLPVRGPQALRPGSRPGRRDQRGHGLVPALPAAGPGQHGSHPSRRRAARRELAIKTPRSPQKARNLSGGTQQKVVVAKWLTAETKYPHLRRAHPGHRRRCEAGDLPPSQPARVGGQVDHHHLLGAPRVRAHEPPHHRHVRGPADRRAVRGGGRPGADP